MKTFKKNKYRLMSSMLKYSFVFVLFITLFMPAVFIHAAVGDAGTTNTSTVNTGDAGTTNTVRTGDAGTTNTTKIGGGIDNPLPGINDIPSFIVAIIHIILIIAIPIITLAIIYTGFLFVQAQGKPDALKKAKDALVFTLIGAAIILGAFVITSAIQGTVDQIKSSNV